MLDTNKLIIEDKEGKIYLAWHVNHRGNFDDTWVDELEKEEVWFSNDEAYYDIFELGLVIQTLVKNIDERTPEKYKKYFYNEETLLTEDPKSPEGDHHMNRLKIFERNSWEKKKELFRKAKHMDDFYTLWKNQKFGNWKWDQIVDDEHWDGLPPFRIVFEWEYPDFFIVDRFIPDFKEEDIYYLSIELGHISGPTETKFCYYDKYDLESYQKDLEAAEKRREREEEKRLIEKKKINELKRELKREKEKKEEKEAEWMRKQMKQKDLFE